MRPGGSASPDAARKAVEAWFLPGGDVPEFQDAEELWAALPAGRPMAVSKLGAPVLGPSQETPPAAALGRKAMAVAQMEDAQDRPIAGGDAELRATRQDGARRAQPYSLPAGQVPPRLRWAPARAEAAAADLRGFALAGASGWASQASSRPVLAGPDDAQPLREPDAVPRARVAAPVGEKCGCRPRADAAVEGQASRRAALQE